MATQAKPGQKPKRELPSTVKAARAERQLLQEQLRLRSLRRQVELFETLDSWSTSDWWQRSDPWDRLDGVGGNFTRGMISIPSDRRHGNNWPIFQTEAELHRIRQDARILIATNSYARGLLHNLRNYIIGKGFSFKAAPKKGAIGDSVYDVQCKGMAKQVQVEIDDFCKSNSFASRQQEGFDRTRRDGDLFIRYFEVNSKLQVRVVEPERIINPPGATAGDGWSYGIRHKMDPEDVETVEEYHIAAADPTTGAAMQGEFVKPEEILHIKVNTDRNVKRGLTDFCFDTLYALRRAAKLQRNLSESAAIQAAIAEITQYETARKSDVEDFVSSKTDFSFVRANENGGRDVNLSRIEPGTRRHIPKGQVYVPPPFSQGIPNHMAVVQGDLRNAAQAFQAPEYLASGDASNANFSSTKEAGVPFVKSAETLQEFYKEAFLAIVIRALQVAIDAGRLPGNVLDLIEIQVEAPVVITTDISEQAQADQVLVSIGSKSPQTCALERGLDPEQEIANIEEHRERLGSQGPELPMPGTDGGMPTVEGLLEGGDFDENKVKRDHGKFASKAGAKGGDKESVSDKLTRTYSPHSSYGDIESSLSDLAGLSREDAAAAAESIGLRRMGELSKKEIIRQVGMRMMARKEASMRTSTIQVTKDDFENPKRHDADDKPSASLMAMVQAEPKAKPPASERPERKEKKADSAAARQVSHGAAKLRDSVSNLYDNAASDSVTHDAIKQAVADLGKASREDVASIGAAIGLKGMDRLSKSEAVKQIGQRIAARKGAAQTTAAIDLGDKPTKAAKQGSKSDAELRDRIPKLNALPHGQRDEAIDAAQKELRSLPPVKNEAAIHDAIGKAIAAQKQANPFQRVNIKDAYEKIGKAAGLSVHEFQGVLARMQDAGKIHMGAYTQALSEHPAHEFLLPANREFKYYLEQK